MPEDQLKEIIDMQSEQLSSEHPVEICEESPEQVVFNVLKSGEAAIAAAKENGNQAIEIIKNSGADQTELLNANEVIEITNRELDAAEYDLQKQVIVPIQNEEEITPGKILNKTSIARDRNFEGSIIVKTKSEDGQTVGYAIRRDSHGNLEGNKIGYMPNGSTGPVYQLHQSDFDRLAEEGILEAYDHALSEEESQRAAFPETVKDLLSKISWRSTLDNEEKKQLRESFMDRFRTGELNLQKFLEDVNTSPYALAALRDILLDELDESRGVDKHDNKLIHHYLAASLESLAVQLGNNDKSEDESGNEFGPTTKRRFRENLIFLASNALKTPYEREKNTVEAWLLEHLNDLNESVKPFKSKDGSSSRLYEYSFYNIIDQAQNPELFKKIVRMAYSQAQISEPRLDRSIPGVYDFYPNSKKNVVMTELEDWVPIQKMVSDSPSAEIQKLKPELIEELIKSETPREDFEKIEAIFLKNCLPEIGKINKIFEVLYRKSRLEGLIQEHTSPVLKKQSDRGRRFQIFKDLLDIHLKSGNESLKDYLRAFQDGQAMFAEVATSGVAALSPVEQKTLDYQLKRLETLYDSSWLKKTSTNDVDGTLTERFNMLSRSLGLEKGGNPVERLQEMYLRPIGLKNVQQALLVMNQALTEAEKRGLAYAAEFSMTGAHLKEGDLLKGIEHQYLEKILQNGSVAAEFLGSSAISDSTPLDTDLAMVKQDNIGTSFEETINNSIAGNYGQLLIALKDRGQFYKSDIEDKASKSQRDGKPELFMTGIYGNSHYGIRTGFASTEIDFLVARQYLSKENLNQVFIDIARKGVYIPVVSEQGELIFTPEMYESLRPKDYDYSRLDTTALDKILSDENFQSDQLLDSLKECFGEEYEHAAGTWENYSIGEHTQKVMEQYEKYFTDKELPTGTSDRFFRLFLALHDIGKPQAIEVGNKEFQHYYTEPVMKKVFEQMGFGSDEIKLAQTLVGADPVGAYLQEGKIEDSAQYILQKSAESSMTPEELLDLFIVFYKCDAGSYTENAGGQASLDDKFIFDETSRTVEFAPETELKINKLKEMIKRA
ncbi:MAG: hypothetical protein UT48_C0038G0002 [Parcubacteria group bacterium GW2011_GWE2_39_37]|uniref:HD domain-containing protein n=1 Tax=Candidatus Falkowbacteria bacterium GW2011_GWF2_39_8 TaxID=1618642 RepID=A0A0G0PZF5_9BACT|nr:MAG: hypothetical protein UT48_C0038G0002 [Parcubacteria group bacterium GW2011_GWE2_39_37]KKR33509.1 MAG: hypothetical protein UT64_C0007G0011 [Candidatus Falkowbacteria bacterium GW2011_GWF2_39_8]